MRFLLISFILFHQASFLYSQTQEDFSNLSGKFFMNFQDSLKASQLAFDCYNMVEGNEDLQTLSNYYLLKAIFDQINDEEMALECEKKGKAKIEFNQAIDRPETYQNPQIEWAYEYLMEFYKNDDPALARRAIKFLKEHNELVNFTNYSAIAYFYERTMDFEKAAQYYRLAFDNIDYEKDEFISLVMPAFFYMRSGEFEKVEDLLSLNNELLESSNQYTRPAYESSRDMIQMYYYLNIGDFANYIESAESYYEQQYQKNKENLTGNPYASISKLNKAMGYEQLRKYNKAEEYYRESENASEKWLQAMQETYPNYKQASFPLLHTYLAKLGDLSNRESRLNELDQFYQQIESYSKPTREQLYQKAIQFALYKHQSYPALFEEVLKNGLGTRDFNSATKPYAEYAYFLMRDANYEASFKMYNELFDQNLSWINDLIFTFGEKAFVAYFTTKLKEGYDNYHSFVRKTKDIDSNLHSKLCEQAFENILLTKSIAFKGVRKRKKAFTNSNDSLLINLYNQWIEKKQKLIRMYQMVQAGKKDLSNTLNTGQDTAQSFDISEATIESLQKEINLLENKLATSSKDYKETLKIDNPDWQSVRDALIPGEAAIEIIRFQWRDQIYYSDSAFYAAYIIKHDSKAPEVVYLPTLAQELDGRYYNFYRNSIKLKVNDPNSYIQYWKAIKSKLGEVTKVYFSPDGIYHLINMSSLKNPETGEYLLDELELINVTSTVSVKTKKSNSSPSKAVLIGRPKYSSKSITVDLEVMQKRSLSRDFRNATITDLPGTEEEVKSISLQLEGEGLRVESLIGLNATEDRLYEIKSPDILHIATHGFWSNTGDATEAYKIFNAMMNSGLLLTGVVDYYSSDDLKDSNDGILTAYEAQNLDLEGTDLVVLSACETGLGNFDAGEGVYGLQRAFRTAGANAVITTLWKIDDQASKEFMIAFYGYMIKTGDRRKAFRSAQFEMKEKYKQPYFWAAFILTGN